MLEEEDHASDPSKVLTGISPEVALQRFVEGVGLRLEADPEAGVWEGAASVWEGVARDGEGAFVSISWSRRALHGSLPQGDWGMPSLRILNLSFNPMLTGDVAHCTLPPTLQELWLDHTQVSGNLAHMKLPGALRALGLSETLVSAHIGGWGYDCQPVTGDRCTETGWECQYKNLGFGQIAGPGGEGWAEGQLSVGDVVELT